MGLFDSLGQKPVQQAPVQMNPRQMQQEISKISANPNAYLKERGLDIPNGMTDPEQMVKHLLRSGQIGGPRAQMAQRLMQSMGHR